jgi:phage terminase large subunit-like protein
MHVQPTRDLHDTLITGMGARRQPLVLYITTAGYDRTSLCWELHDYATKVRDGIVDDPSWLVRIFAADPEDDWADPQVWRKAHPGLGVSVSESFLAQEASAPRRRRASSTLFGGCT